MIEKTPRQLISEARVLIKKAGVIEAKAEGDPRLFAFASINRSLARNNLIDADIALAPRKPQSALVIRKEMIKQYRKAKEDYWRAQHASPKELRELEEELGREGLLQDS